MSRRKKVRSIYGFQRHISQRIRDEYDYYNSLWHLLNQIREKCLMGIKLKKKKKPVSLDTFLVKAISKASPSATHINLQNAITESHPVFYGCAVFSMKRPGGNANSTSFHFLSRSIRYPMIFSGLCLERAERATDRTGDEY